MSGLLVAIGDSFTEGVGDPHLHYPNGVRGWADRLARQLGRADPSWRYANLAIRSKFLDQVVAEQLDAAIAMGPSHICFNGGGNDLLSLRADVDSIAQRYEAALTRLTATGAEVVVVTTFEPRTSRLVQPLVRRVADFNDVVRDLAATHGATLIDHARMPDFHAPMLWAPDRIHMSRPGHKRMAAAVADRIGVPHTLKLRDLVPAEPADWRRTLLTEVRFAREEVIPLLQRRITGRNEGDTTCPKWPVPIHPADGMKRLAAARATRSPVTAGARTP